MSLTIQQTLLVNFRYSVHFLRGVFNPDAPLLLKTLLTDSVNHRPRFIVVIDDGLAAANPNLVAHIEAYATHHAQHIELVMPPLLVPGGETVKNQEAPLKQVIAALATAHIDRHSYLVAIGGGAVLDMAGFAAATVHRGIRLIRMPSTVLAQNDAAVGVKNGINAFGCKNFLGSFAPPYAVISDFDLLHSLPRRDYIAGLAEAVKAALIRDAAFFDWLEQHAPALCHRDAHATEVMIQKTAEIHMQHIAQGGDPFEMGSARPLDFGHWAAHRLETLTQHQLRHGEAVAIGIALDCQYAALIGLLAETSAQRILALLQALSLPTEHALFKQAQGREQVLVGLQEFQEHLGGELTITLLETIGQGVEVHAIQQATLLQAMVHLADSEMLCTSPTAI